MCLLLKNLNKEYTSKTPIWLMRQAGRYLPEYKEVRKQAGSFLNLCYNPNLAKEVTLQPVKRFDFDAAILFSDILVVPNALGVDVKFLEGEGPVLEKLPIEGKEIDIISALDNLEKNKEEAIKIFSKIWQTVNNTKKELEKDKCLLGFCGAPWTVALYLIDNKPSKASEITRSFAYKYPELFDRLMDILVRTSAEYICGQIKNGADAIQIFDSWASQIPDALYEKALKKPTIKLCKLIKEKYPKTPIILFPRGLSESKLLDLVKISDGNFNCLGLDYTVDMNWACENLQKDICLQGNLDPAVMLTTPENIKKETIKILKIATKQGGYIFNFGHGILPNVPIKNVEALVETVKNWENK